MTKPKVVSEGDWIDPSELSADFEHGLMVLVNMALIASALGDTDPNLSCVRIMEVALKQRAALETAQAESSERERQAFDAGWNGAGKNRYQLAEGGFSKEFTREYLDAFAAYQATTPTPARHRWELDPVTPERLQEEFDARIGQQLEHYAAKLAKKALRDVLAEIAPLPRKADR